ncbi:orotate phosphoribosyltransferase [Patescibacteria group bacterium]|nr:orotate phosphoribosyltransferase [Patescibacteria group bacterium]MBU2235947.1 orotate phosphoribosyltransferase [Patescibacteria group bacterium]
MNYKKGFIEFLVKSNALKFGEFTLKSGRISPYFFSTGNFNTGESIYKLGYYYAALIKEEVIDFDVIFGPAYKGIPLAVATSLALAKDFGMDKGYLFDRKEIKDYGDKSAFVGYEPESGQKVLLIDDVMTTGKTKEDAVNMVKESFKNVSFSGLVIAFNRQEQNKDGNDALLEFEKSYGIPVKAIVTVREVIDVLYNQEVDGQVYIDDRVKDKMEGYLSKYGVTND